jgi:uncharacterized protein (TIGR02996 family)
MATKTLKHTDQSGDMDVRSGVPGGYRQVTGHDANRLRAVCRRLNIPYAPAFVREERWGGTWRRRYDGVVVSARSLPRVLAELDRLDLAAPEKLQSPRIERYETKYHGGKSYQSAVTILGVWQCRKGVPSREEAALWLAIRRNPDDTTPWLVYADWLQDHDDEAGATAIRTAISTKLEAAK